MVAAAGPVILPQCGAESSRVHEGASGRMRTTSADPRGSELAFGTIAPDGIGLRRLRISQSDTRELCVRGAECRSGATQFRTTGRRAVTPQEAHGCAACSCARRIRGRHLAPAVSDRRDRLLGLARCRKHRRGTRKSACCRRAAPTLARDAAGNETAQRARHEARCSRQARDD